MNYGHLEKLDLKLLALSPVFIGSGSSLTKKEYIFDWKKKTVYFIHLAQLSAYLKKQGLSKAFENFLLNTQSKDLGIFLRDNGILEEQYKAFLLYSLKLCNISVLDKLYDIHTFVKGPDGLPYIPGSSLKGSLRTVIAAKLLEKGSFEKTISDLDTLSGEPKGKQLAKLGDALENSLFCKLNYTDPKKPDRIRWDNIINDFMRGIQISDSLPIEPDRLMLCAKIDRKPDGTANELNIYRECICPGTEVHLSMTLEKPILDKAGVDVRFIEDALREFAEMHNRHFEQYFKKSDKDAAIPATEANIILGGGTGYASKSLVYPLVRDRNKAVRLVGKMLSKQFPKHGHDRDSSEYMVSPHMLKTAQYAGSYYQMGKCKLTIG